MNPPQAKEGRKNSDTLLSTVSSHLSGTSYVELLVSTMTIRTASDVVVREDSGREHSILRVGIIDLCVSARLYWTYDDIETFHKREWGVEEVPKLYSLTYEHLVHQDSSSGWTRLVVKRKAVVVYEDRGTRA